MTHLVILSGHGCIFGLGGQVAKLVGQFVGQSSEVVRVGVGLSHLRKDEKSYMFCVYERLPAQLDSD